jgi:allantoin racemase
VRIKVIIPNSSGEFRSAQVDHRKSVAYPGTVVDVVNLAHGPLSVESAADDARAAPYVLEEVHRAAAEGYDAVTVDCAADVALRAVKEVADIPVASAGEAAFLLALAVGDRFGVITVLPATAASIRHNINSLRLDSRCAGVRAVDIPVLNLDTRPEVEERIYEECRQAITVDGADAIVLGCTGMARLARRLGERLPVPVIEPGAAAIKLAEVLASLRLRPSRIANPRPAPKPVR